MTCIVAWAENNKICIGGDSAGVAGYDMQIRADEKVFKNGEMIFGFTSSFRMGQLLRFSLTLPKKKENQDDYDYMCTDFINSVRECFKNGGYLQKYTDGDEKGGTFLVAYKNRLFKVENDFQVGETINGFDSCGCGQDFALGVLFTLEKQELTTEQKLTKALEAAEFLSTGVASPFVLIGT